MTPNHLIRHRIIMDFTHTYVCRWAYNWKIHDKHITMKVKEKFPWTEKMKLLAEAGVWSHIPRNKNLLTFRQTKEPLQAKQNMVYLVIWRIKPNPWSKPTPDITQPGKMCGWTVRYVWHNALQRQTTCAGTPGWIRGRTLPWMCKN